VVGERECLFWAGIAELGTHVVSGSLTMTLFNPCGGFAASVHLKQHRKNRKMSQELQLREVVFTCYKSAKVTHSIAIDRKLQACSLHIYSEIRTAKHANNVTTHNFQKLSFLCLVIHHR